MGFMVQEPNLPAYGKLSCMRARIDYTDDGTPFAMTPVPAGTELVGMSVKVTEAFNDGTTDELTIGNATTADKYGKVADVTMPTPGTYSTFSGDNAMPFQVAAAETILLAYTGGTGDSTTGIAYVTVWFAPMAA